MQAILLGRSETSKLSTFLAPLSPLTIRFQVVSTPQPSGVSMPRPVTTTRLILNSAIAACAGAVAPSTGRQPGLLHIVNQRGSTRSSTLGVFLEVFDRVADGQDGFSRIVRNFAAELFLERHHEFDGVEAVRAKIVDEACVLGHLVG